MHCITTLISLQIWNSDLLASILFCASEYECNIKVHDFNIQLEIRMLGIQPLKILNLIEQGV